MNILHLITTINRGGAENHLTCLVRGQKKYFKNIHIIYLKGNDYWFEYLTRQGIKVVKITNLGKLNFFQKILFIRNYINQYNIDIVHSHLPYMEILGYLSLVLQKKNIKFFITKHVDNDFIGGSKKVNRSLVSDLITHIIFKKTNKVIAISNAVKKYLCSNKFCDYKNKINVVYYGIDHEYMSTCINKNISVPIKKKDELIYCFIGRLVKQKQVDLIIKSFFEFQKKEKFARLIIVGDGPEKKILINLVLDLKIQNKVEFLGHINEIGEIIKQIDVFCMNSRFEGLGLILLEVMYFSIPIIAPKISAIPEVVLDDINGLLVESNNINEYTQAMIKMLNVNLRNKFRENSNKILTRKFSFDEMIEETIKLYNI